MEQTIGEYRISDERSLVQLDRICEMLKSSYWASERARETIADSIGHSLCYGVYCAGEQVGFARCVTDYATMYYLCDVIIDERHRAKGLGTALVGAILSDERLQGMYGILVTRDAHGLYATYGFEPVEADKYMKRPRKITDNG